MRKESKIINSLFPSIRQRILSTLVLNPDKWWFLSDLAKHLGTSPSSLQRELGSLNLSGILLRRVDGKRTYYRADENCPILKELQGIFLKTSGLVDLIRKSLKRFDDKISVAFVFGSIAKGEELSKSDVDLMIIGKIKLSELASILKTVEKKIMREINPVIYSTGELKKRIANKDHFLTSVLKDKKLFIKGDNDDLEAIIK